MTHSTAPDALRTIIDDMNQDQSSFTLFHILGSGSDVQEVKKGLNVPSTFHYYQIKLGFVIEHNQSRWLTHDEISNGVIRAIQEKNQLTVVGTLEPWSMRP
ncbi:short-chain dehydrogenase [Paenibacillus sp. GCM10027629]|uniref:short-chain dehydrogenase n=1 Tax=Paenibacillus sp. GCM10027629 TaxID=3273414 RepID=UPI00363A9767